MTKSAPLRPATVAALATIDERLKKKTARDREFYAAIGKLWVEVLDDPTVAATRGNLKGLAPAFKHSPDFLGRCRRLHKAMPIMAEVDDWVQQTDFANPYPTEPFAACNLLNQFFKAKRRSDRESIRSPITDQTDSPTVTILTGDARVKLAGLANGSVNCCVTSPPYHGLMDYESEGQIGREDDVSDYIMNLTEVFKEVRRVLTNDGTCWINIDDRWASGMRTPMPIDHPWRPRVQRAADIIAAKNLICLPDMLARALQANGWVLRSRIIWVKTNGNRESVQDRPPHAYETILLMTKSQRYLYNPEHRLPIAPTKSSSPRRRRAGGLTVVSETKMISDVWDIPPGPNVPGHPAPFPVALPERCISLGCPAEGRVLDPFMGSGSTGIAAHRLGMKFTGIELNPSYVTLARTRIATETSDTKLAAD